MAVGDDGSTTEQSASPYVVHEPWLDTLAGRNVHVVVAKWVGTPGPGAPWPSLWTEVVYQDSGAVAYRAQWTLASSDQQLRYTLSRDSLDGWTSMWVELTLEAPPDAAAGPGSWALATASKNPAGLRGNPTPLSVDAGAAGQEGEGESRQDTEQGLLGEHGGPVVIPLIMQAGFEQRATGTLRALLDARLAAGGRVHSVAEEGSDVVDVLSEVVSEVRAVLRAEELRQSVLGAASAGEQDLAAESGVTGGLPRTVSFQRESILARSIR